MAILAKRLGIDLGTANVLVTVPKQGVVINEPSVVALDIDTNRILAVGNEAKEMVGRTPDNITASRPLKDGVIAEYRVTAALIRYFINKVLGPVRLFRPEVMVSVPAGISSTERRAVVDAVKQAGAKETFLIKEPLAAAIGAGIPISSPSGNMIVDIGGGTTEVAVISLGGIVAWNSVRIGGNKLDSSIIDYVRRKYGLQIGETTAEAIKMEIGSALTDAAVVKFDIRGRDMILGLPKTITISSVEITEAMEDPLAKIVLAIKAVLEQTPPELSADIINQGMVISGGGALLKNLDRLISRETGVPALVAEEPLLCVVKGTGIALDNLDDYKKTIQR